MENVLTHGRTDGWRSGWVVKPGAFGEWTHARVAFVEKITKKDEEDDGGADAGAETGDRGSR